MAEILREQGHQEGWLKGLAEGEAKGEAKHVDEASHQRIQACTDTATLERWLDLALSAKHLSEVLDDPAQ